MFRQTITAKMPFRAQLLIHHAELGVFKQEKERFMDGNEFVELDAVKIFFRRHSGLTHRLYVDGVCG
ncbi:hypothetical protein MCOL2_16912 [Listeria fleischmannii FSL S10-1203]|uniref:Uncharacterized protein n=1 Tax=Listeria fleischmannii FSL S10-1203 TaxID=1265822 RepID=W7DGA1_9LIST|nr:hypothetical protein MCOL2_16912 [Listeria fleischmannii FSL S10-1203]